MDSIKEKERLIFSFINLRFQRKELQHRRKIYNKITVGKNNIPFGKSWKRMRDCWRNVVAKPDLHEDRQLPGCPFYIKRFEYRQ